MTPRAVLLALGFPLLVGACRDASPSFTTPAAASQALEERQTALATSRRTAIVDATTKIAPSVVSIHVTGRRQVTEAPGFWDFFLLPQQREQRIDGFGTGFVLRADGIVVTNEHVVAEADSIVVSLADGTEVSARVLGQDPTTDIAVLRVARQGLPVPTIGRSTDLMIGEWVVALGNPFVYMLGNSAPSVSAGVVSATGRNILPSREQSGLYLDMIQTDAAINPGNSGGPLVNALGEVIGVNSSILSQSGGSVGLGFAIPIERAVRVADEIIRTGKVRRAWTGLEVGGPGAMRDWKSQGGLVVTRVAPGGPAAGAGLGEGSILVEANGRTLRNFLDWEAVKLDLRVGDPIEVTVRQGTRTVTRRIVSGDLPTVTAAKVSVLRGLELVTVTPAIQAERGLRSDRGALIFRITAEVGAKTGLAEGDVLIGVDRTRVASAQQFATLLDAIRPGQPFRIYLDRGGQVVFIDLAF